MKGVFLTIIGLVIPLFFAWLAFSSARNRVEMLHRRLQALSDQIIALCASQQALLKGLSNLPAAVHQRATRDNQPEGSQAFFSKLTDCLAVHRQLNQALASLPDDNQSVSIRAQWNENSQAIHEALKRFNELASQYESGRNHPLNRLSGRTFPEIPLVSPEG